MQMLEMLEKLDVQKVREFVALLSSKDNQATLDDGTVVTVGRLLVVDYGCFSGTAFYIANFHDSQRRVALPSIDWNGVDRFVPGVYADVVCDYKDDYPSAIAFAKKPEAAFLLNYQVEGGIKGAIGLEFVDVWKHIPILSL